MARRSVSQTKRQEDKIAENAKKPVGREESNPMESMASKPKQWQDAIEIATKLMGKNIRTLAERQAENKRKLDNNNQGSTATSSRMQECGNMLIPLAGEMKREYDALELYCYATSVIQFGKRGKLNPWYIGPFKILKGVSPMAYTLELPKELSNVHNTFHVSNLKKYLSDESLIILMKALRLDDKLNFVEEPIQIMDCEVKQLRQSLIPIVKVRWNSKRGLEFTWEREDQIRAKYPHLFSNITPTSN
ncbi:hypothetical protein Tco_0374802 [Tanacetum coccineum]